MESKKKSYERKKGEHIPLKTNLPDIPLSNKLLNWKSQSINEILNQPLKEKKKFSSLFSNKKIKKGFLNNSMIFSDSFKPNLNLDLFNSLEVLTQPTFKLDINKTVTQDINNKNNTFKILLKENYSQYITGLKRIYPSFKFNHYKTPNPEFLEYYKKYGEEGDINNRHFKIDKELMTFRYNHQVKDDKEYKKSNLLDILGAQENIECEPSQFKIKEDFLSRTDIFELKMIQKDLQFKTGIIDKELNYILMTSPQKLYNYIEDNKALTKKMKDYQIKLLQRRLQKKRVMYNYRINSANLIVKGHKKRQNIKVLTVLKNIDQIYKYIKKLKEISMSESENKIKEINDILNILRDIMKKFNTGYNKDKNLKCITEIEKIIQQYENQGEENLNEQLCFNIKKLINNCLIYYQKSNETKVGKIKEEEIQKLSQKWNLLKENDEKNKIIFLEKDANITEEKDNIFIQYLLIYNNINNTENNILKLLISILDMFEIIIKDNLDINVIVSLIQDVFLKLITKNYEVIQKLTNNRLLMLNILSLCFSVILSNYFYIILLIQNNFGFRIKIFGDVTEIIQKEMDKNLIYEINFYYNDILSVNKWKYFISETRDIKKQVSTFFDLRRMNIFKLVIDKYKEFEENFNEEQQKLLKEKLDDKILIFEQKKGIDITIQQMFDIIYDNKELTQLKFNDIELIKNDNNINQNEFIIIHNEKITEKNDMNRKVSIFSFEIINFIYNYLLTFVYFTESINYNNIILGDNLDNEIDNGIRNDLISFMYNEIKQKLEMTKNIMINNQSGVVNNKQITDKETCIYYSDIVLIQNCLNKFLLCYPEQEMVTLLNTLSTTCIDLLVQLIKDTTNKINEDFENLDFKNYPIVNGGKGYNNYVNYFTILKRIYDNMNNCFTKSQINKEFNEAFNNIFNKMSQIIEAKGIIEVDDQLKQIRNEFNYIKKVFKLFPLVDTTKSKELIDELIIKVNPNKLPTTKKKKTTINKDKETNKKAKEQNKNEEIKEENKEEVKKDEKEQEGNNQDIKEKDENNNKG